MSDPAGIETWRLRASPGYELVLFDRLPPDERAALADLRRQGDFYGILRPVDGSGAEHRTLRAVDRETALLILTLSQPGPVPSYARDADPTARGIAQLVLDGILEIEAEGAFVTGPEAARRLAGGGDRAARPRSGLAQTSWQAVSCAAALDLEDRDELAGWLYSYNRVPLSSAHLRRYPDAASILALIAADETLRARGWAVTGGSSGDWISLSRHGGRQRPKPGNGAERPTCKLYVSPRPAALPDVCAGLLPVLEEAGGRQFKIAGSASGLLRPDKVVAYFDDPAALLSAADALADQLRGAPSQGVPFTEPVDADGLLSWGVDPPASSRPLSWQPQHSWRSWVASTLAGALLQSRSLTTAAGRAAFALERLALEGVDVDRWAPGQRLWRPA